jgi:hypothetical protein
MAMLLSLAVVCMAAGMGDNFDMSNNKPSTQSLSLTAEHRKSALMEHRKAVLGGERGEIVRVEKLAMVEKRIVVVGPANITWAICTEKKKGTFGFELSGGDIKFGLVFKPSSGGLCC